MQKKIISIIIFLLFLGSIFSQTRQISSLKATAEKEFKNKNYYGAAMLFKECLEYDNRRHDIIWKIAEASRLDNDYPQAAKYYK
ncbi:MAG: hypothetical protein LBV69_00460, partial [Bacteroidales bacterium]|nr:hypothetical protein [Bacteroidales bacterium]